jgi:hypothetical protein
MNVTFRTPAGCEHVAHIHEYPTFDDMVASSAPLSMSECKECGEAPGQFSLLASSTVESAACATCGLKDGTRARVTVGEL